MIECEVVAAIPGRILRWRQTERTAANDTSSVESLVTFEASPNTAGTHLRIIHDQFRRIDTQAQACSASVLRLEPSSKHSLAVRTDTPKIVCALGALRRAA